MAFRKRRSTGIDLAKTLDSYQATSLPGNAPTSAVTTIRCWSCSKPNIYDGRHAAPRRCSWCKTLLN